MRQSFVFSCLAAVGALAAPQAITVARQSPPTDEEFGLTMTVNGAYVSLNAVSNGTEDLILEAQRLSVYPGTPAYLTGTSPAAALSFDLTDSTTVPAGVYGVLVPSVGDNYGYATPVLARKDYEEFEFSVTNGTISHRLTAALQSWFACLDTVNGEDNYVLKWGVFQSNGSPPAGCATTTVQQNFNVPGGARPRR
ncbi:Uu.00g076890.m01.CDS01 [Anthostomella pinea]|uniref:Uu.00g076890.m01.CDS01 n=1 Tax=Anthostomella pinea TaxID=933095 RepID=A0AAI8YP59_9PEZI|nr:Uu.00g076890.m01.CDS01 [Anthostomella pinea]